MKRDISDILDKCIEEIIGNRKTVDDCLLSYKDRREELEPMLLAAIKLLEAGTITPDIKRKQEVRERFIAAVEQKQWEIGIERKAMLTGSAGKIGHLRTSLVRLGVITAIFTVMSGATLALAKESLPGSPFYPVKLAIEKARIGLVRDASAKRKLYITAVQERVAELKKIKSENAYYKELVEELADNFEKAEQAKVGNKSSTSADDLNSVVRDNEEVLEDILEKAPPTAKPAIERALENTKEEEGKGSGNAYGQVKPPLNHAPDGNLKSQPNGKTKKSKSISSRKHKTNSSNKVKAKSSATYKKAPSYQKSPATSGKRTNGDDQERKN